VNRRSERAALAPPVAVVVDAGDVVGVGGEFQEVVFIHGIFLFRVMHYPEKRDGSPNQFCNIASNF
jgi:hypothetical protein